MTCAGFMLKDRPLAGRGKVHLCRVLPTTPIPPVCFLATSDRERCDSSMVDIYL